MKPGALVELRGATVRFGAVTALHDVHMSVRAGERLALVGSNGSGKTTLLRTLHGQLDDALDARTARVDAGAKQAMLFQRPFLLSLSVWRNLRWALWLAGVPASQRDERARLALERVRLLDLRARAARTLSGGQQQRLALARAWAVEPELIFLDEPTASLDPQAKREVEELIATFAAEGMTVVMSTHNLGQAKRLATRVLYLEAGRVVCDLPVREFFEGTLPEPAKAFLHAERM
jgi:tungstate transport system ATP-binding protein